MRANAAWPPRKTLRASDASSEWRSCAESALSLARSSAADSELCASAASAGAAGGSGMAAGGSSSGVNGGGGGGTAAGDLRGVSVRTGDLRGVSVRADGSALVRSARGEARGEVIAAMVE
eukprot:2500948-Prymnesium_polylepis.1